MFSLVSHIWTAVLLKFGPKCESMKEFGVSLSFFLYMLNTQSHTRAHTKVSTFVQGSISRADISPMAKRRAGLWNKLVLLMSTSV